MARKAFSRLFLVLMLAFCFFGVREALALGPFSHFEFAVGLWPELAEQAGFSKDQAQEIRNDYLAGAIAPDAGYYPEGDSRLADLAHLAKPWDFCRALLKLARTPREKAFALGWLTHAVLDLRAHALWVNPIVGGAYSTNKLLHKQVEWGLDCRVLEKPGNAWMWNASLPAHAGLDLWIRAQKKLYNASASQKVLLASTSSQIAEVDRLPMVWWLGGRLFRPDSWFVNSAGWVLGGTIRPLYVAYLEYRETDLDVQAVLTPREPSADEMASIGQVMENAARDVFSALGGDWPEGNLDADQACMGGNCRDAEKALELLKR